MKTIKYLLSNSKVFFMKNTLILSLILLFSCNETAFLKEDALSLYTPENSYVTPEHFEAAVNNFYYYFREIFYTTSGGYKDLPRGKIVGTDLLSEDYNADNFPNELVPTSNQVNLYWKSCYRMIYDANVIIGRSESEFSELTEEQKIKYQAGARFFRGYAYRILANIYGGVPIVLEETTEPKRDFVRASRDEVYQQSVSDLKFAAENLKGINEVAAFKVSNLAAYHALSEVYISLKQWDNAISAASAVIDDPNTALMTERFGSRVNDVYNPDMPWASGGDVYWDLFRKGNQNRSSGNTEALWVIQLDYYSLQGGGGGTRWESVANPRIRDIKVKNKDKSFVEIIPYVNSYYGGKGNGKCKPSDYLLYEIWDKNGYDQDIRNADYNIIRGLTINNPAADDNGKWMFKDNLKLKFKNQWSFWPMFAKICTMGDHPKEMWLADQTVPGSLQSSGGVNRTYRNYYEMRLAETYLLRAEAYLGKNDLVNAAKDINVVRNRAQAPEVKPAEVNIDYILDERARELCYEENRMMTLTRLGKLVERNNKYNPQFNWYDHQNLWPIPFSEIEKNTGAVLEQNPGY